MVGIQRLDKLAFWLAISLRRLALDQQKECETVDLL